MAQAHKAGFVARGGFWVISQFALMFVVFWAGWQYPGNGEHEELKIAGLALLILSACLGAVGALTLGRALSPLPTPSGDVRLVQNGVYALMRHPLYTALGMAAVGWAAVRQSWGGMAAAAVFMLFLDRKAREEERSLRSRCPEYGEYERRVRRFIPRVY